MKVEVKKEVLSTPTVSIIIPLYNQERYFRDCLNSIARQTYQNLEIIIVNDGSSDRSPLIARDWALRDHRFKVIDKENEGTAFARRDGYLAATGDFISFLDSDDMLPQNAIEIMVKGILENDVDLFWGSYCYKVGCFVSSHKDKVCSFPVNKRICQPELFDKYYIAFFHTGKIFPVMIGAKIYRKRIVDEAYRETGLFSKEVSLMGEDLYFNMKLFPFLRSMYRTDKIVYIYRHGGGTFGFNRNFPQVFKLSDIRLDLLDEFNYTKGYEPLFEEYVAFLYHHAAQLIHFKKADRKEIEDFYKFEIEHRRLVPRLKEYYAHHEPSTSIDLLIKQDYEGMYNCACRLRKSTVLTPRYRIVKFLVDMLSKV